MSYTVLSRKWRPKTFEHVIGQDHITKILKNSISQNKVSHAYLFSGPRGVGKTTIARILSCVLNKVEKVEDSIDIIELDGASNRGIDEIREIKESETVSGMGHLRICKTGTNMPSKGCVTWRESACGI